ncbi:MAG: hypothetical protein H7319_20760 [Spirosoma sp.]|nr:hypothetical protein [Spirosoma sp.]
MNRTVSPEAIHCITDCELLRISRDGLDIAASRGTTQQDYTVQILTKLLEANKQRAFDMANLTAEERYQKFLTETVGACHSCPGSEVVNSREYIRKEKAIPASTGIAFREGTIFVDAPSARP